ncbi:MAG: hypothetical protein IPK27_00135 [Rhodanobacteraceae bacterium]|nr:hypothetical protein [Rhodanobacteraceae bacterium]
MTRIAGGWTRTGIGAAAPGTLLGLRVRGVATVASSVGGGSGRIEALLLRPGENAGPQVFANGFE